MGTGSFSEVGNGRGVTLTPHPLPVPWSRKSRAIPLLPPIGRTACTETQCLHKGDLYFYLFIDLKPTEFLAVLIEYLLSVYTRKCFNVGHVHFVRNRYY